MRICIISSTPLPPQEGIGFYVWNLSRYLTQQGHQVQLITRGGAGQTYREVVDGITIWRPTFVPTYPFHVQLHGIFVDRLIREIEPDVDLFHLHSPLVKRPKTKRPLLVTVHTPMKSDIAAVSAKSLLGSLIKLQAPVSYRLEQQLFERADKLTAVASSVAQELEEYGLDPQRVSVLGNGVDTELFFPLKNKEQAEHPYALTVARLAPRKGLADLIRCAEDVVKHFPDFRFLIAGSGPMEKQLRAEIARRGLGKQVILLGHIGDRAQLIELYRRATLFVHPAHYEGLPTVLLEAMACACPVVTTAVSGALDVVQNEVNGLLVPARAPEQMASAIIRLLRDADTYPAKSGLCKALGVAACQTIEERYSWHVVSRNYVAQYETLLSKAKVSRVYS